MKIILAFTILAVIWLSIKVTSLERHLAKTNGVLLLIGQNSKMVDSLMEKHEGALRLFNQELRLLNELVTK